MSQPRIRAMLGAPRFQTALLACVATACVIRFWLMPITSSFWVDESVTAFLVTHPRDPSFAIAPQAPLSVYFWLPRLSTYVSGSSEAAYRWPSLVCMALAVWLIARLAARLIHRDAAWFVVFGCFALRGLNFEAIDARPYALGILVAAASLLFLVRWLDRGRWLDALGYLLAAALLWPVHLAYWPFYFVHAIYAGVRLFRRETPVPLSHVAVLFVTLAALEIPVAREAMEVLRGASSHVIAKLPALRDLGHALEFFFVVICVASAWLFHNVFARRTQLSTPSASSLCLCLCWWLVTPLALFAFSWIGGNSVFVPRYYSEATPGVVFAAASLSAFFLPAQWWKPVSLVFGICVLIVVGDWSVLWPKHSPSDWRGASAAVTRAGAQPDTPIICPSPFIEAQPPNWRPNYPIPDFLSCHLVRYPFPGTPILFPFAATPQAEAFAAELTRSRLAPAHRFFLYGSHGNVPYWRDWFARQSPLASWSHHSLGDFGDVDAMVFDAP